MLTFVTSTLPNGNRVMTLITFASIVTNGNSFTRLTTPTSVVANVDTAKLVGSCASVWQTVPVTGAITVFYAVSVGFKSWLAQG
jgi:hypothetical protein